MDEVTTEETVDVQITASTKEDTEVLEEVVEESASFEIPDDNDDYGENPEIGTTEVFIQAEKNLSQIDCEVVPLEVQNLDDDFECEVCHNGFSNPPTV